jgi:hypothetical protein
MSGGAQFSHEPMRHLPPYWRLAREIVFAAKVAWAISLAVRSGDMDEIAAQAQALLIALEPLADMLAEKTVRRHRSKHNPNPHEE